MVSSCSVVLSLLFAVTTLMGPSSSAIVGECSKKRKSNRCTGINAFWQYDGICIDEPGDTKLPTCHVPQSRKFSFKLVASVVQIPNITNPLRRLWVKGSGPGLSWEKSREMTKVKEGYYTLPIEYVYDSNALLCLKESRCTLNQRALEFRFYRDVHGVDGMLGPNIYVPLPISDSISGHADFSPPYVFSYPWFDGRTVLTRTLHIRSRPNTGPYVGSRVRFTVFYPPSYRYNTLKRYPVVIVFGVNLEHLIVRLLESMFVDESVIEEAFVFGYQSKYGPPYCEYSPFLVLDESPYIYGGMRKYKCGTEECEECMNCLHLDRSELCDAKEFVSQALLCGIKHGYCHARGNAVLDNIETTLLPKMAVLTMGRIMVDFPKDRITIIGLDGGGLLACYAAISRPQVSRFWDTHAVIMWQSQVVWG